MRYGFNTSESIASQNSHDRTSFPQSGGPRRPRGDPHRERGAQLRTARRRRHRDRRPTARRRPGRGLGRAHPRAGDRGRRGARRRRGGRPDQPRPRRPRARAHRRRQRPGQARRLGRRRPTPTAPAPPTHRRRPRRRGRRQPNPLRRPRPRRRRVRDVHVGNHRPAQGRSDPAPGGHEQPRRAGRDLAVDVGGSPHPRAAGVPRPRARDRTARTAPPRRPCRARRPLLPAGPRRGAATRGHDDVRRPDDVQPDRQGGRGRPRSGAGLRNRPAARLRIRCPPD